MRQINLETWQRKRHFIRFSQVDYPHFSMCANVDLTGFYPALKQHGISFNLAIVYVISRAANMIPEFRQRIRPGMVVEHDVVNPGTTIMAEGDLFTFTHYDYDERFPVFAENAARRNAYYQKNPTLDDPPDRDDLLFMTSIPWVSFTSFMHPLHLHPVDSVPRFAWGKFYKDGQAIRMPLSVQGHHALMDGLHMGKFYKIFQDLLEEPDYLTE